MEALRFIVRLHETIRPCAQAGLVLGWINGLLLALALLAHPRFEMSPLDYLLSWLLIELASFGALGFLTYVKSKGRAVPLLAALTSSLMTAALCLVAAAVGVPGWALPYFGALSGWAIGWFGCQACREPDDARAGAATEEVGRG
ncbi:hypothetical protein [Methylibium sp.]|uniref:hypothetical protein n=1 Tax=Methylibium sp. TaxID=2067992 RepID=UPI0017AFD719|nr:hypothetical protein [Methylibium sp.]MBA3590813.1 hypothetical protein [Methylibium sp.]